ncbi:MAG: hypothetical protein ACK4RM_04555 [Flavobacterium sp.]
MKSDITFPKVENVFLADVKEWNDDFMEDTWFVHLINDNNQPLESVMVVSKAFGTLEGEMKKTSMLRHAYMEIPAHAAIKIEMIEKSVLALNNEFMVTYFMGSTLYDKKFVFRANTINDKALRDLPVLEKSGVLLM